MDSRQRLFEERPAARQKGRNRPAEPPKLEVPRSLCRRNDKDLLVNKRRSWWSWALLPNIFGCSAVLLPDPVWSRNLDLHLEMAVSWALFACQSSLLSSPVCFPCTLPSSTCSEVNSQHVCTDIYGSSVLPRAGFRLCSASSNVGIRSACQEPPLRL